MDMRTEAGGSIDLPEAYGGNEPYIFISYSHRDQAIVIPIVARLLEDGFRVWYDYGIDPGTEWDETIAARLKGCTYFFALVTPNYQSSKMCRREMKYVQTETDALSVVIYLRATNLSDGMKFSLGTTQNIHWYRYADPEDAFSTLYKTTGIERCQKNGAAPAVMPRHSSGGVIYHRESAATTTVTVPQTKPRGNTPLFSAAVVVLALLAGFAFLFRGKLLPTKPSLPAGSVSSVQTAGDDEPASSAPSIKLPGFGSDAGAGAAVAGKKLTDIQSPVEYYDTFRIEENVASTMGTVYEQAVVLRRPSYNVSEPLRLRYNVADYNSLTGFFSVPDFVDYRNNQFQSGRYRLLIYLDENVDDPVLKVDLSRSTLETALDLDLRGANFLTFVVECDISGSGIVGLLLTDCVLSTDAPGRGAISSGVKLSDGKDRLKLTAIQKPVEYYDTFRIEENVANTMGTVYEQVVVLRRPSYNASERLRLRYNVADYNSLTGFFSVPDFADYRGSRYRLVIYLDENEDDPVLKVDLTRSTPETALDLDLHGANLLTFEVDCDVTGSGLVGLLLTDCVLQK